MLGGPIISLIEYITKCPINVDELLITKFETSKMKDGYIVITLIFKKDNNSDCIWLYHDMFFEPTFNHDLRIIDYILNKNALAISSILNYLLINNVIEKYNQYYYKLTQSLLLQIV